MGTDKRKNTQLDIIFFSYQWPSVLSAVESFPAETSVTRICATMGFLRNIGRKQAFFELVDV